MEDRRFFFPISHSGVQTRGVKSVSLETTPLPLGKRDPDYTDIFLLGTFLHPLKKKWEQAFKGLMR